MTKLVDLIYSSISGSSDCIASLILSRPEKHNAFNGEVIEQINFTLSKVEKQKNCRLLLIRSKGKLFSAGADLAWMKSAISLGYEDNVKDAKSLFNMLSKLKTIHCPTLAVVQGGAFGGALGLIAACDFSVASNEAFFSLSEVRIGLLPAVILPFLSEKISRSFLSDAGLTGVRFSAAEAYKFGLLTKVVEHAELKKETDDYVDKILKVSPYAVTSFKKLLVDIDQCSTLEEKSEICCKAIAEARVSDHGQEGLSSFFDKRTPNWGKTLSDLDNYK